MGGGGTPMTAITLSPEEKAIVERLCDGCRWWSWFEGCSWNKQERTTFKKFDAQPMSDCGAFEVKP